MSPRGGSVGSLGAAAQSAVWAQGVEIARARAAQTHRDVVRRGRTRQLQDGTFQVSLSLSLSLAISLSLSRYLSLSLAISLSLVISLSQPVYSFSPALTPAAPILLFTNPWSHFFSQDAGSDLFLRCIDVDHPDAGARGGRGPVAPLLLEALLLRLLVKPN